MIKVINKILNKYSFTNKETREKYVEGMRNNDPAYRYPTYIFLFVMLALSLVEFFPVIIRWGTAIFTILTSAIIVVLRK